MVVLVIELGWFILGRPASPSPFPLTLSILTMVMLPPLILLCVVGAGACALLWKTETGGRRWVLAWVLGQAAMGLLFVYIAGSNTDSDTRVLFATAPLVGLVAWIGAATVVILSRLARRHA